jgi:hypothetical protein
MSLNRSPTSRGRFRDRPAGRHPSTTHQANAWKRHTSVRASREWSTGPPAVVGGPDGNVPTRDHVKTPLVTGMNAALAPHRNVRTTRWLRLGSNPQYTAIFRRGGGRTGSRARAPAATNCSASTYARTNLLTVVSAPVKMPQDEGGSSSRSQEGAWSWLTGELPSEPLGETFKAEGDRGGPRLDTRRGGCCAPPARE